MADTSTCYFTTLVAAPLAALVGVSLSCLCLGDASVNVFLCYHFLSLSVSLRPFVCSTQAAILSVVGNKMNEMWQNFSRFTPGFSGKVIWFFRMCLVLRSHAVLAYSSANCGLVFYFVRTVALASLRDSTFVC